MDLDGFVEGLSAAFGRNIPVRLRQGGSGISFDFTADDIKTMIRNRPGESTLKELIRDRSKADAFLSENVNPTGRENRIIACSLLQGRAHELYTQDNYEEARLQYEKATKAVLGGDVTFPLPVSEGLRNKVYTQLDPWDRIVLFECCNGVAQCLLKLKFPEQALVWLEEINTLYKNAYFVTKSPLFEWMNHNLDIKEYFSQRVIALRTAAEIFFELGNTGMAVVRMSVGQTLANVTTPSHHNTTKSVSGLIDDSRAIQLMQLRHPDPQLVPKNDFQHESLQVRGSWQKLKLRKAGGIPSRMGFASFIHNGYLYVAGGQQAGIGPFHRDLWRLNLANRDGWRPLAPYPIPMSTVPLFRGLQMAVHEDKAYLFTGRPTVDYFDLISLKWGTITTKFKPSDGQSGTGRWLYPGNDLTDYTAQMANGCLYIFGGTHDKAAIGCNLLVELNIATCEWTHLSGTVEPKQDYSCPGPRKWPASWVNKEQDTLYIMHGMADRAAAQYKRQANAADNSHACEDFWSWSIPNRKWRQERINGNPPCSRAEHSYTYNAKLDRTIVFGGYHPDLTTLVQGQMYSYTYFADTFIFDPSTLAWKQIITRGFPTYRAEGQIVSDPETGRTFLFGGFVNSDYVPDKKHLITRTFADLWELKIDMPGGGFESVDVEEEKRTAKAGPWHRCFSCGSAGRWMKCGGTCKGRVFFCDPQCLKDGWREHKETHNCRKKD